MHRFGLDAVHRFGFDSFEARKPLVDKNPEASSILTRLNSGLAKEENPAGAKARKQRALAFVDGVQEAVDLVTLINEEMDGECPICMCPLKEDDSDSDGGLNPGTNNSGNRLQPEKPEKSSLFRLRACFHAAHRACVLGWWRSGIAEYFDGLEEEFAAAQKLAGPRVFDPANGSPDSNPESPVTPPGGLRTAADLEAGVSAKLVCAVCRVGAVREDIAELGLWAEEFEPRAAAAAVRFGLQGPSSRDPARRAGLGGLDGGEGNFSLCRNGAESLCPNDLDGVSAENISGKRGQPAGALVGCSRGTAGDKPHSSAGAHPDVDGHLASVDGASVELAFSASDGSDFFEVFQKLRDGLLGSSARSFRTALPGALAGVELVSHNYYPRRRNAYLKLGSATQALAVMLHFQGAALEDSVRELGELGCESSGDEAGARSEASARSAGTGRSGGRRRGAAGEGDSARTWIVAYHFEDLG